MGDIHRGADEPDPLVQVSTWVSWHWIAADRADLELHARASDRHEESCHGRASRMTGI